MGGAACAGHTNTNPGTGAAGGMGPAATSPSTAGLGAVSGAAVSSGGGAPENGSSTGGRESESGGSNAGSPSGSAAGAGGTVQGLPPGLGEVWKSAGCGQPFPGIDGALAFIHTEGTKAVDCAARTKEGVHVCGPWQLEREYRVYLPDAYDPNHVYPLVLQAPGCGGTAEAVYDLGTSGREAIRIGLTPPPSSVGHGTNPGEGCFDDKEGDDSVDFAFYEALYDRLGAELCFDRNRVFASGASSGAWFANELGCKYAGDPGGRPVRGVMTNGGSLPTEPQYRPTCTGASMAGLFVFLQQDDIGVSRAPVAAISRAMQVNHCSARDYRTALLSDYPIGGDHPPDTCQQLMDCDAGFPLVVCPLSHQTSTDDAAVVNAAADAFISTLVAK